MQPNGIVSTWYSVTTKMTLHILELARVTPAADSDSLAIPLTFFDIPWLLLHPIKRVFFYKLTDSTLEHFHSFILPKLKLSLSLALTTYLPLTGRIVWDPTEPKPNIIVSENDAVSVTIAETNADFSLLSGYGQRPVSELLNLVPDLPGSNDSATTFSLQITLFPNKGFSIGAALHHAVLDGKTVSMFFRSWSHLCKQLLKEESVIPSLPKTLTPSLDRSLIKDQTELDKKMIDFVRCLKKDKSLTPVPVLELGHDVVLTTLVLTSTDVEKLREQVKSQDQSLLHLSTFVVAYAYVWTCLVKARGGSGERLVSFIFAGDFRERLDPPLPATYFGNCVFPVGSYYRTAADFEGDGGFVTAVEILSGLVRGTVRLLGRFGIYETDFGWGKPVKSDVVSIRGEVISMAERRDGSGGVEIGVCMKKTDMDDVLTLFNRGLQN
ncbi:unnamed protein product [Eruca vesicaria subsp. sativa]|uniref:Uncharacterized protein n=1 Tax=Eruca vesicaria subsp. sativa TaxID=29727 RepID=A0ABC8JST1_ERUVS|nr:unnamed protein product [Eruca vesicaria subsp. sativa]